jgi:tetratricopeptide (TPR) repeat protein
MERLRYILFIFLSLSLQYSTAQEANEIQLLQQDLKNATTDTARVNTLSLLCFNYSDISFDSAEIYGEKALKLASDIHFEKGIADTYNSLGWIYYQYGDNDKAKDYLNTALNKFKAIGIESYYTAPLSNLATVYLDEKNYTQSVAYFKNALQYSQNASDEKRVAICLYNIGKVYNAEGDHMQARQYFAKARDMEIKLNDEVEVAADISTIANTYQFEDKYDSALIYYHQVLPVFLKHHDIYRLGNTYENMGIAFDNKKEYAQANENLLQAKNYYTQLNSKTDIAYVDEDMGNLSIESGNTQQAFVNYNDGLKLAGEIPLDDLKRTLLLELSDAYKKTGDYKNAYLFADSSYKIKDSLFTKEKQDELVKIQTQFETEQKEKENQLLKEENVANAIQLKENKTLLIAAVVGLVLLIALLYVLYRNGQSKVKNIKALSELNTTLHEQKEEIMRINTVLELKALHAQMNPHFIFNCMSSIQECILTGRIEDANTYLTKLSRLLRMVLNHADDENILLDRELEILNLYLQLEKVRLKGSFEYSINIDEEVLSEELKVPTLILQPFAENGIWHGLLNKPDNRILNISGAFKNDMLVFTIEDNGIGRTKAAELRSTHPYKSRAIELIKKRLQILQQQSRLPRTGFEIYDLYNPIGTKVEIILPIINS